MIRLRKPVFDVVESSGYSGQAYPEATSLKPCSGVKSTPSYPRYHVTGPDRLLICKILRDTPVHNNTWRIATSYKSFGPIEKQALGMGAFTPKLFNLVFSEKG